MSGLVGKWAVADEPGLDEVNRRALRCRGPEFGPVPWPPTDLPCCEGACGGPGVGSSSVESPGFIVPAHLFGRHSTTGSELARTGGIRLSN